MPIEWIGLGTAIAEVLIEKVGGRGGDAPDVGRALSARLNPIFERSNLPEYSQNAVADAVWPALQQLVVDPSLIVEHRLDPESLSRALAGLFPAAESRLGGHGEDELYHRVLEAAAGCLTKIALDLPGLDALMHGKMLQGQEELQRQVDSIPAALSDRRQTEERKVAEEKWREWEEKYWEQVVRTYDNVELFGVRVRDESKRQRLSVAYVSLHVDPQLRNRATRPRASREGFLDLQTAMERSPAVGAGRSVEEVVARSRRLLILGDAGSGKTTILKWLATNAAGRNFQGSLASSNDAIPIVILLRDYVDKDLPQVSEVVERTAARLGLKAPDGWLHACLTSRRALIMVDGVDEMPEARRGKVRTWLRDLVRDYGDAQFVVTSRPSASTESSPGDTRRPTTIDEGWLDAEGFDEARIQPMSRGDIYRFLERWHVAVRAQLVDEEEKSRLADHESRLRKRFEESAPLRNLASLPLLCAAICALNRETGGHVPQSRKGVYEALCAMLLERRELEQDLKFPGYSEIDAEKRRVLLQQLAHWMMRNGLTVASRESLCSQIERRLPGLGIALQTRRLLQALVERSGIIREPTPGSIDFLHRSLQEYLCARAVADEDDIGYLVEQATRDEWREVVIWAPAYANKNQRQQLFTGLLNQAEQNAAKRHRLYLLAVACRENAVEIDVETVRRLDECLEKIVPPKNADEAKVIAAAGVLAVPHLGYAPSHPRGVQSACVHALGIIGGEAAFAKLKTYAVPVNVRLLDELVRAGDSFDQAVYYQHVLAPLEPRRLRLESAVSLDGVRHLTSLEALWIAGRDQPMDLEPVAQLSALTSLTLWNMPGVDLWPLGRLPALTSLMLRDMPGVDLRQLARLPALTSLSLRDMPGVDLGQLAWLPVLTSLTLEGMPGVALEPLAQLPALTSLSLGDMPGRGLRQLARLPALTSLTLRGMPGVYAGLLTRLTQLVSLSLSSLPDVVDLGPLAALTNLTHLELDDLPAVTDLSSLRQLPLLQHIAEEDLHLPLRVSLDRP